MHLVIPFLSLSVLATILLYHLHRQQEAQLMLTNPRDAFRGQSRSPNIVPFDGFHLVWYSNCVTKRYPTCDYTVTWKPWLRSLKVIRTDMYRSATYDFLLTFHRPISYRFRDKRRFQSKIAKFSCPRVFCATVNGVPLEFGYRRMESRN